MTPSNMRSFFSTPASVSALVLLGLGLSLSACSIGGDEGPPTTVEEPRSLLADDSGGVQGIALDEDGNVTASELEVTVPDDSVEETLAPVAAVAQGTAIYFTYDSTAVEPMFMPLIQDAVAYLQDNPTARVRLEGHADERGTRAYNLALGERRAQSVRDVMLEQGALAEQVEWVSYGEELPAAMGQDESTWERNRRVEIIREE